MQCTCGSELTTQRHEIKTAQGALMWTDKDIYLPVSVRQDKCPKCGRVRVTIRDATGDVIESRG